MTIRTHNPNQVRELQDHLDAVGDLDEGVLEDLGTLAAQFDGRTVLPLIGAGGSYDCGMPLAKQIGADLLSDYLDNPSFEPHVPDLDPNMGDVTAAIYTTPGQGQLSVVEALGLPDAALWPDADHIMSHFCAYRVLARLAREELFAEAVSLNYDCAYEAGLKAEGFTLAPDSTPGSRWRDHATLIADPEADSSTSLPGSLTLRKLHGCAHHYRREVARGAGNHPENRIIVRRDQLDNWRNDTWARDYLRAAARTSILLLLGFSGQDPVIAGELTSILTDVYAETTSDGQPRVVVVDYKPDTARLRGLIYAGLNGGAAAPGSVTMVKTKPSSTTATLLALLTEILCGRLRALGPAGGYIPPDAIDERMAAVTVAAPVMLRWSYLLRKPQARNYNQRTNLNAAARRGYVPLLADPATTVQALKTRARLRTVLGHTNVESTREALTNYGFVTGKVKGKAYLPSGVDFDTLRGGARPAGELEMTREVLDWPAGLDCVLVAEDVAGWRGISVQRGHEVSVP